MKRPSTLTLQTKLLFHLMPRYK